ncbi:MazF family transcriptional regulator [Deinococcus pimensis]|uniref:MazF family transcriptional regulator n=1 Tax=Deinococcus pimensis TaxID=309888 RepID=UPI0004BC18DC|nr:MazF family transcriptional regulator [Deinococcus pimensis]
MISRELKELTGIEHEVEIQVVGNVLLVTPARNEEALRQGRRAALLHAAVSQVLDDNDEVLARLKDA